MKINFELSLHGNSTIITTYMIDGPSLNNGSMRIKANGIVDPQRSPGIIIGQLQRAFHAQGKQLGITAGNVVGGQVNAKLVNRLECTYTLT